MVSIPSLQQQLSTLSAAQGGTEPVNVSNVAANSPNNPVTIPDANLSSITSSNNNTSGVSSVLNSPSLTTQTEVIQPSGSNFASTQLPVFQANELNGANSTGIPAASTASAAASQSYTSIANTQLGVSDATIAGPSGAASPVTAASLQSPSNVFNNAFSTTSSLGVNVLSPNQPSSGRDPYDRVKLRFKPGHPMASYPQVLAPLARTNGMVWLYKPAIQIQSAVDYETLGLTHSIQEIHAFSSNKAAQISVSGQFVVQDVDEAMYALAAIHFMKSVTKMSFGTAGPTDADTGESLGTPLGSPPPVLLLSGYGNMMMNDIPVIVTNFSLDMPADVDYISIPFGPGSGTKIPVSFSLLASLVVQQAPRDMRAFDLDSFTQFGKMGWW